MMASLGFDSASLFHKTHHLSAGSVMGRALRRARRNQTTRRALLGMDGRKPDETPQWWPGDEGREAMCCSFCGGRDHRYEACPQRTEPPVAPAEGGEGDMTRAPDS
jgi:hypothetical protein